MGKTVHISSIVLLGGHKISSILPEGLVLPVAGTGKRGFKNGNCEEATFHCPTGVAASSKSIDVYVADTGNNVIRKISNGKVTTFAGTGVRGHKDGAANEAQFRCPRGVIVDDKANVLYVCDNHCIRRVSLDNGAVDTLAGGTSDGFADRPKEEARFSAPTGLCLVEDNTVLLIADTANHRIRALNLADGSVTTFCGQGKAGITEGKREECLLFYPRSVALNQADGCVYIADDSDTLRRVGKRGVYNHGEKLGSTFAVSFNKNGNLFCTEHTTGAVSFMY